MSNETTHDIMVTQTEKAGELLDYFQGQRDNHETRISAKETEVDTFLSTARAKLSLPITLTYDPTVIIAKETATADPNNTLATEWKRVDPVLTSYVYHAEPKDSFVSLILSRIHSYAAGYHENPKYSNDWSRTYIEFVFSSHNTDSAIINQALEDQDIKPKSVGSWSHGALSYEIPFMKIDGQNPACVLYARFKNRAYTASTLVPDNAQPQEIMTYGGNASFAVQRVEVRQK